MELALYHGMRSVSVLFLWLLNSFLYSQDDMDYIVKSTKDTIYTKIVRMDKKFKNVVCEEKEKNCKYNATTILSLKHDTSFYEVGLIKIKRKSQSVFLKRVIKGKLSLYELKTTLTKRSWKIIGSNFIHLRWVYRAQDGSKKIPLTVYYYKKENETYENFSESWKVKTRECKLLNDKIKSENWKPTPLELVRFYNTNCN